MTELRGLVRFFILLSILGFLLANTLSQWQIFLTIVGIFFQSTGIVFLLIGVIIIVTVGLFFYFIVLIVFISNPISQLTKYYLNNFRKNFFHVLKNNLIISPLLYFTFIYLINPLNYLIVPPDYIPDPEVITQTINSAFVVTLVIIPAYLLSIRTLAIPVRDESIWYFQIIKNHYLKSHNKKALQERFISFYFSITATTWIIMTLLVLRKVFTSGSTTETLYSPLIHSFFPKYPYIGYLEPLKIFPRNFNYAGL
ncbi:MAG: hypothetical protein WC382_13380 [Methanoregulaceae archaeon]|jgi:hypothetical protein